MKTAIGSNHFIRSCFVAAAFALALGGCGGGSGGGSTAGTTGGGTVTLTSIAITPDTATVAKGATANLTATGTYSNGSTANVTTQVTWTSAAPAIASVGSSTGVVTGVTVGTTTATASLSGVTSNSLPLKVVSLLGGTMQGVPLTLTTAVSTFGTASFNAPYGITTDGTNLYVADSFNHLIRKIVIATGVVSTLAGSGAIGATDGTGTAASFNIFYGITTDGTNLYVADSNNNKIRKIVIATGVVSTLAGSGAVGAADGTGTAASFNTPFCVTTDGTNLYVGDTNGVIRKIVISTGVVTTLPGGFNNPVGITTDGTNLFVVATSSNIIYKYVIATGTVTALAGSGAAGAVDGTGTAASFNAPYGITTDGTNLYVADRNNQLIRKVVIATGVVTTLAGSGAAGSNNGIGTAATFVNPTAVVSDGTNLYVTEQGSQFVRKIQ